MNRGQLDEQRTIRWTGTQVNVTLTCGTVRWTGKHYTCGTVHWTVRWTGTQVNITPVGQSDGQSEVRGTRVMAGPRLLQLQGDVVSERSCRTLRVYGG